MTVRLRDLLMFAAAFVAVTALFLSGPSDSHIEGGCVTITERG